MKICVLQSAYGGASHLLENVDPSADPARFIRSSQHEFHHHWIKKSTAVQQIDQAITTGYDFYLNFMWGQHEDNVAGLEAVQYFESKGLPFVGIRSCVLLRSKLDFYRDARRIGAPNVPGESQFPLFVKPALSCASMFISQQSVCHNGSELVAMIKTLDRALAPRRKEKAQALALSLSDVEDEQDIVVQEFIEGQDYSCIVIEMCDTPIALSPTKYVYPSSAPTKERFLTFDIKNLTDVSLQVMKRVSDPGTFDMLQRAAIEGFRANQMSGCSWCNVDIRVKASGQPFVMEVNPMPAVFLTPEHPWEDSVILESLPGGHLALLNIMVSSYHLQLHGGDDATEKVAKVYDDWSQGYEKAVADTELPRIAQEMCSTYDFSGTVLDLGSGTGLFGRTLHQQQMSGDEPRSLLLGIDISEGMAEISKQHGYSTVYLSSIPRIIPTLTPVDHIVSLSVLHFLSLFDMSLVLCRTFQIASKSVTLLIDEIPEIYNRKLRDAGEPYSFMVANNHLELMQEFGTPNGWILRNKWQMFTWKSYFVDCEIHSTAFRFERDLNGDGEINPTSHGQVNGSTGANKGGINNETPLKVNGSAPNGIESSSNGLDNGCD